MRLRGRARSAALASAAAIGAGAIALPALAADTLRPAALKLKVVPNKAGTPQQPQPVKVKVDAGLLSQGPSVAWTVDKGTVRLGKGLRWNGAKHPTCTAEDLETKGLAACPKGSIIGGWGRGLGPDSGPPVPKTTAVNGGRKLVFAFMQLTSPARVNAAVPVHIKKLSGRWAYELTYDVPPSLEVVAGVPISFAPAHGVIGKGDILATTSCPLDRKWKYNSATTLVDGRVVKHTGSTPCRR